MDDLLKKAKIYALKNALSHSGKASAGSVISSLFNEGLKKEDVKRFSKDVSKIILETNSMDVKDQEKEFEKNKDLIKEREIRQGLFELPDSEKGVIMRFAPSASGPFHIGHAATSCLSFMYFKKYGGKFYVRIEDTNPENIDNNSYKMIKAESKWLFDNQAEIIIQSDRLEIYYSYVQKLIKKNFAYVCVCSPDEFRSFSKEKKPCPCRKNSSKSNLNLWKKMLSKKEGFNEGEAVLRFKSDMGHKNPAMRDFPLARINESSHPRTKNKFRVWPLMNLAVAADDIELKMTHIIRAKDHRDNAERQKMIFEALNKKFPWTGFLGRYKFKDLDLSTTKMRQSIEKGEYSGWDDEKLPTIASLKKQGYKPLAFWKFSEQVGLSENDKVMDKKEYFLLLKNFNKSS